MQNDNKGNLAGRFEGFGAAPSEELWGRIDAELAEDNKRRGFIWWWVGSGIAAMVFVGFFVMNSAETTSVAPGEGYSAKVNESQDSDEMTGVARFERADVTVAVIEQTEQTVPSTDEEFNTTTKKNNTFNESALSQEPKQDKVTDKVEGEVIAVDASKKESSTSQLDELASGDVNLLRPALISTIPLSEVEAKGLLDFELPKKKYPWELGFAIGYYTDLNLTTAKVAANEQEFIDVGSPGIPLSSSTVSTSTITADRDINIKGFVEKHFTERFSWRTGLNFSRSTYFTEFSGQAVIAEKTALSALELPISLRLDLIQRPVFELQAGLGWHNELSLVEKLTQTTQNSEESLKYMTVGYLGGLEGSITANFKLNARMCIFGSLNYRYYLTQQVPIHGTILERNHWLGGNIGMSWSLGN